MVKNEKQLAPRTRLGRGANVRKAQTLTRIQLADAANDEDTEDVDVALQRQMNVALAASPEELRRVAEECRQEFAGSFAHYPYSEMSYRYKVDKRITLAAVTMFGLDLAHAPLQFQNDEEIVLTACSQDGRALSCASDSLRANKEVVMAAVESEPSSLKYALGGLDQNEDILKKALSLLPNPESVTRFCAEHKSAYQFASRDYKSNKAITMAAVSGYGRALKFAPRKFKSDVEVVMAAISQNGIAIKYAHPKFQNDKKFVLVACSQDGGALKSASKEFRKDKEVVLAACSQSGTTLELASKKLQDDYEVVLAACKSNGSALEYASVSKRSNKQIVLAAVESNPESLKFALSGLNQDKHCLVKAKLWDDDYEDRTTTNIALKETVDHRKRKIVLSTKFSLSAESSAHATRFTVQFKRHPFIADGQFVVYSPNAFNKGTCDPNWTDRDWPCRGTYFTCQKPKEYKTGLPQESKCCWRYSFRYHLRDASHLSGFMIQVVDLKKEFSSSANLADLSRKQDISDLFRKHDLGNGQSIETEMAHDVGTKIFRFFEPMPGRSSYASEVDRLVSEIKAWYKGRCRNMEEVSLLDGQVVKRKMETEGKEQSPRHTKPQSENFSTLGSAAHGLLKGLRKVRK